MERANRSGVLGIIGALTAGFVLISSMACLGMNEPTVAVENPPAASPTQAEVPAPALGNTVEPAPADSPEETGKAADTPVPSTATPDPAEAQWPTPVTDYSSTGNMWLFFSGEGYNPDDTYEAITLATVNEDKSMVPVMIEMLRFFWDEDLLIETSAAISLITGEEFGGVVGDWSQWMEWLGRNAGEYQPPKGYVAWKSTLMSLIDPRFGEFLLPAEKGSRINVAEIAWGGVIPDRIPDLRNAPVVKADEQDYLLPGDRVFGVSINGEHRAYPLRIVNAHEMANDVLGGEPIALAY